MPNIKHWYTEYTYKHKGRHILQQHYWLMSNKWSASRYIVDNDGIKSGPHGVYKSLSIAKKAIDAWEKRQYKKDKVKFSHAGSK